MQFLTLSLLVTAATTALAAPSNLAERQLFSNIRSDVERKAACKAYTVIFARGTTEFGNVGDIAGPPFFNTLDYAIGTVAVQGVEYPADIAGFLAGGSNAGAITAAQVATKALTNCPNTKLIYSGYSQGAQVTRKAIAKLATGSKERNAIAAIVHFGDPNGGAAYPSDLNNKHRTYCAIGDLICDGTSIVLPAHLTYGLNAAEAAAFVKSVI